MLTEYLPSRSTTVFIIVGILMLFVVPYTRNEMKLLTAGGIGLFIKFVVIFARHIIADHLLILKNLVTPRKVIFPTLEGDEQTNLKN